MSDKLLKWVRPEIRALSAYHVADATGLIKLDAMENPFALPDDIQAELVERLSSAELNRYPDPSANQLRTTLRRVMEVPDGMEVVLGNGSDELIQMLTTAVAGENACMLSFEPGFVMYRMIAEMAGVRYVGIPLDADFQIDVDATLASIDKHQPALIFIAYPNNPSANLFTDEAIEKILWAAPGIVVVDEAYHPFAQASFMSRLSDFENLLVMRTVSKMGLAGLRLGVLCGPADFINEIDKVRLPYNINVLTQLAASCVLENQHVLQQQAIQIRQQRKWLSPQMEALDGLKVYPSQANFILFRLLEKDASKVFKNILEQGVLIKNMKATSGALAQCLRVTIGSEGENEAFLNALKKALQD